MAPHLDATGAAILQEVVAARVTDLEKMPFAEEAELWSYLSGTGGAILWAGARALGSRAEAAARGLGTVAALAAWLRAVPELEARGRAPLPDGRPQAVQALARAGLARLRSLPRPDRPARLAGLAAWQAAPLLRQVVAQPGLVAQGGLGLSEFDRRLRLIAARLRA